MKIHRIAAVFLAAALLTSCGKKNDDDDEYIGVYEEITSAQSEAPVQEAETAPEITPPQSDYLNKIFICGKGANRFSSAGLLSADQTSDDPMGASGTEMPYVYLWQDPSEINDYDDYQDYAQSVYRKAYDLREACPESMVLILSCFTPDIDCSDVNSYVNGAIRSCPDIYMIYNNVTCGLLDINGYLMEQYTEGSGLNAEGLNKVLENINLSRFYNDMVGDVRETIDPYSVNASRPDYTVTEGKVAYLTFDDGPSKYTPQVLDILAANDIKATFFITGWVIEGREASLKRAADEGHCIGLHSWSHDYDLIYADTDAFLRDFAKVYQRVTEITGKEPWAFRFPGGSYNNHNTYTADEIISEMQDRGFAFYDWNCATSDATSDSTYESCIANLKDSVYADHSVVLMHDSLKVTPQYLQDVIDFLREEGYSFETIETADEVHFH